MKSFKLFGLIVLFVTCAQAQGQTNEQLQGQNAVCDFTTADSFSVFTDNSYMNQLSYPLHDDILIKSISSLKHRYTNLKSFVDYVNGKTKIQLKEITNINDIPLQKYDGNVLPAIFLNNNSKTGEQSFLKAWAEIVRVTFDAQFESYRQVCGTFSEYDGDPSSGIVRLTVLYIKNNPKKPGLNNRVVVVYEYKITSPENNS